MATFTPLGNRVLVTPEEAEETYRGIIIPDAVREKPQKGVVVAVGPGVWENGTFIDADAVEVGDQVLFSKYGGTEIKVGDAEFLLLREDDILGILTED